MRSFSFELKAVDVDANKRLSLSSLLKFLEEASIEDVLKSNYTKDFFLSQGLLWIISRLQFKVTRWPNYGERINIEVYKLQTKHGLFPRTYVIYDEEKKVIIEGSILWALMDEKTRNMIDPTLYQVSFKKSSRLPSSFIDPFLINVKSKGTSQEIERIHVPSSSIDLNNHLTNSAYGNYLVNLHSSIFHLEHPLTSFTFVFFQEIKEGSELVIKSFVEPNTDNVSFIVNDKVCFLANLQYK
jgi:medium-chain acyl-[acyl-carrier-protein] hydrolase